jgi:CheY-specific phosphatase CheX
MRPDPKAELFKAALLTFENLSFVLPTEKIGRDQEQAAAREAVRVDFHGPIEGCLILRLRGDVAPALAAGMLGAATPPDRATVEDAVKEVSNVVCGNFLPAYAGDQAVFRLDAPRLVDFEHGPSEPWREVADARVGLEGGLCEVRVHASGPVL